MTELRDLLERLGLAQYLQGFIGEGFESWETLMDVTESDLDSLGVKLGHRRKLQRAIVDSRGYTKDNALVERPTKPVLQHESSEERESPASESKTALAITDGAQPPPNAKRKYRRHPKPDDNAPERPPSAYVIFSNQVRETLKGQELSFIEIAKIVGERWQQLSSEDKEPCKREAQTLKERYYSDLSDYKKTTHYNEYQAYLQEFKAKHNPQPSQDSKRPRIEADLDASGSTPAASSAVARSSRVMSKANEFPWEQKGHSRVSSASERSASESYQTGQGTSPKQWPSVAISPVLTNKSPIEASPRPADPRRYLPSVAINDTSDGRRALLPFWSSSPAFAPGSAPGIAVIPSKLIIPSSTHPSRQAYATDTETAPSLISDDTRGSNNSSSDRDHSVITPSNFILPHFDPHSTKGASNRNLPMPMSMQYPSASPREQPPLWDVHISTRSAAPPQPTLIPAMVNSQPENRSKTSMATLLMASEHLDRESPRRLDGRPG